MGDQTSLEETVLSYNKSAMEKLRKKDFEGALGLLKEAEKTLSKENDSVKLHSITHNNLGCFYKRSNKPKVALIYFEKALRLESEDPEEVGTLSGINLNICTLKSQQGDHEGALFFAKKALKQLLWKLDEVPSLISSAAIAYYNVGIEFEYLNKLSDAFSTFKRGWEKANHYLGKDHLITKNLKQKYEQLSKTTFKITTQKNDTISFPSLKRKKNFYRRVKPDLLSYEPRKKSSRKTFKRPHQSVTKPRIPKYNSNLRSISETPKKRQNKSSFSMRNKKLASIEKILTPQIRKKNPAKSRSPETEPWVKKKAPKPQIGTQRNSKPNAEEGLMPVPVRSRIDQLSQSVTFKA